MTNTQSKPSKIPQYFIFRNDGSRHFKECLGWFNQSNGINCSQDWGWYGKDSYGTDAYDDPSQFEDTPTRFEPAELWALIQEEQKGETQSPYVISDEKAKDHSFCQPQIIDLEYPKYPIGKSVREMAHDYLVALIQAKHNHNTAPGVALDLALDLDRRLKEKGL